MKQNYQYCLENLLKYEGGYSNHPMDKGGPTNFGITIADYRMYIKQDGTAEDVKNMNVNQAKVIYKTKYWDKIGGDKLPSGIDYAIFDYAVHSGVARALRVNKQFENYEDPVARVNAICDERLAFMKSIRGGSDWKVFGKGWNNRIVDVRNKASILARKPRKAPGKASGALIGAAGAGTAAVAADHWWTPITSFVSDNWYWMTGLTAMLIIVGFVVYTVIEYRKTK